MTAINPSTNLAGHDVTIDEFGVHVHLHEPGDQDVATFTVDRAGTFTFYCSVPGHQALGMEGTLRVAGPSGLDFTLVIGIVAGAALAVGVVAFMLLRGRPRR